MAKTVKSKKENSLRSLPNIGVTTEEKLLKIGIRDSRQFLERDPYEVFHELLCKVDPSLCRCALAGLLGAKKGLPWHKVTKEASAEFERRYPSHRWSKS